MLKSHDAVHTLGSQCVYTSEILNPLNAELNPTCHFLLSLLGAHHILHVNRIRVKPDHLPRKVKRAKCVSHALVS